MIPAILLSVLSVVGLSEAALYSSVALLPKKEYDYVIVGGEWYFRRRAFENELTAFVAGTAGGVLAARLSEDRKISVLVIEAGIS